jgi:hypothetical protein
MHEVGPHSRPSALAKLDGRSREARLMQNVIAELTQQIGGKPNPSQRAMIERAAWLQLHVSLMDRKLIEEGSGALSERDGRQYLAWSNALTRLHRDLNLKAVPQKPEQSLAEFLSGAAA